MKTTESHSLQSEYDTLAATNKQLTNQRDVAQKRLDDLDTQVWPLKSIISLPVLGVLRLLHTYYVFLLLFIKFGT